VGIVGLGTDALAAYGEPGETVVFYEIDPAVAMVARDPELFTYVADSRADVKVVLGDGRLRLSEEPSGRFDLLVIDAFSSDAIPVHLLTREALVTFLDKLAPHGGSRHISNRHLDLAPVVARLAVESGLATREQTWLGEDGCGTLSSRWAVLARELEDLGQIGRKPTWEPLTVVPAIKPWTDDFSSLIAVLR
jgi:hypothetical protein